MHWSVLDICLLQSLLPYLYNQRNFTCWVYLRVSDWYFTHTQSFSPSDTWHSPSSCHPWNLSFSCRGTPGTCCYFVSCSDWPKFTLLLPPICSLPSPNWPHPFPLVLLLCLAIQMLSFSLDFGQALNLAIWLSILPHFFSRNSVWDLLSFPVLVCLTWSSIRFLLSASSSSWSLSHLPGIDTPICLFHNMGEHRNTGPISVCCGVFLLFVLLY